MLVLTRRVGEKLVIGNEIVLEILSVSGEGVRLGVVAPRETSVHRFEIFNEIQNANRAASQQTSSDANAALKMIAAQLRSKNSQESGVESPESNDCGLQIADCGLKENFRFPI